MHKAFRVILWLVFSTTLLLIFIGLALQVTSVQNWLIDKVTTYLNKNSNFQTEIGRIRISWWDALEMENISIRDHKDSLMLGADKAYADFSLLSLIPPGDFVVDAVRLERAELNFYTHQGDSTLNINRWITELGSIFGSVDTTAKVPVNFSITSIELRQAKFSLVNFNAEPVSSGFDYTKIRFWDITANADNFRMKKGVIGIDIKLLSGIEQTSGVRIHELKTNLTYAPTYLELDKLSLKSEGSHIKNYLRMDLIGPDGFSDFLHQVKLNARLDETKIRLSELRIFAPSLPEFEDEIFLSGELIGPVSDIKSKEFLIRLGQKTAIFGALELDGLPDINKTYLNLSLKNSVISARDLAPYLTPQLEKEVNKFNLIRLDADFAGLITRFTTNGNFRTSIGNISGRVNYDLVNGVPSIVSRVRIQNLDMGILAGDRELLQKVSLDGNVNLKGNSLENILIDLNANISQIGLNNYNFTNIRTDATYGLNLFRGNLAIDDPNLKGQAKGYVNLNESVDSVRMLVQIDTAFLDKINLVEKPTFISGKLDIDTKGIKLDDIQGIGRFSDIKVGYEERFLDVGDFFFQSLFAGGTRTLSINSDYLVAAASGQFNLEQMSRDLDILSRQYISILLNEEQPIASLEENFSETYNLDLNVRLHDVNPLIQLFQPNISISKNTILEGAFYQTPENTIFNFFTSIDTLSYQGNSAFGVNIDFNTSKIINSADILASFYVYSKEQKVGTALGFENLGLEAIWDQNNLGIQFSLDQLTTQSKARISAETKFSALGTEIHFQPSLLKVLDRDWNFDPENQILISEGNIDFKKLRVLKDGQFIGVDGRISQDPEEILDLFFENVEIDILNTITTLEFLGSANGSFQLKNLLDQPRFEGEMSIDKAEINRFPIGNIFASAKLQDNELILDLENEINGQKKIDINGILGLEFQNLDLDAVLTEANLVILEPFLSNYISNLDGTVSGNLQIRGTVDSPEVLGSGRIDRGKIRVNFLNTSYVLDGSILFQPKQVSFKDLIFRDLNGNRATFTGGLNHTGFNNIFLDINSTLSNFQVLNTTARDNEVFYGTAFATGTLSIRGSTTNLDVTARATTQPNTRIYIPLTSSNSQYQEEFIQIINIQDTVRINQLATDINRLDIENVRMNFILDITPDAFAQIIIDPKTEESLEARGRGILTMNIDTQGNFNLTGNYEITQGQYNFSLYNVVKREFAIQPGGRITWFGDPYQGVMNLKAVYEENISLQPLLSSSSASENSQMRRRYPLKVLMDLQGELLSPNIKFGFDFGQFPSSGDVQTTISAFQGRVAADEQEMNRQVFSVIMTRNFSPEGQFSGVATISSSLGNLLSSQLNSFLGQVDKNLEVNIDLATLDQNTLENFQLSVAYTFLDGRLRVSRDGGFTDNQGNASAASIIGDWQAEYLLTGDGVYRLRIFNRNNYNTFTSLSLTQNVLTYGASITQNVSFNSFSELFKKLTGRNSEKLNIIDSDDFLREEYQDEENWKPLNLEDIPPRKDPPLPPRKVIIPSKEDF
ncbi:MAG: translocation/assembly module TamB domain-containing protein [Algoriphagus sp.]|uniref:translocation/assembly module TamB domain-containing protein n=1 Tax=Algoriphagus sp. TaxID=1872435 RepID=UPI002731EC75|nr:translocation/assembly module TamB domain-containing protein [Algoriphagus sp.]MDP2041416.1 translocation/assembly module TamB domain-containing protein [Algoriphagus sp.]MDP3473722.1 translocation/assembly module TamB domain-containing protein [Algoriphagus sp.]